MAITKQEFLAQLEDQLDLDPGSFRDDTPLQETWDSFGPLAFMVLAEDLCGITVPPESVVECRTTCDLVNLLGEKIAA
jgi:acyl carrier protein